MKKICGICGKEFITYPSVIKNKRGICCSRKCADKWHSIQLTGKHLSKEHKKRIGMGNKGTKREDLKAKWRKFKETGKEIDRPVPKKEPELIEYICKWCGKKWIGRKMGIIKSQQRHFCCNLHRSLWRSEKTSGENNYFYGKNLSGEGASNWQGGKSFEPYGAEFNNILKEQIRERDNYICQLCGLQQNGRKLAIHHIDYDKQNNDSNNLIVLCNVCHVKTNTDREYWGKHFSIKIDEVMSICQ